ncbi:MAG: pyridoxal-5-phosphate-dependent protein subunit beta [Ignavibacteria bacterium CG1_02_37_35]|nr:MAG: pyridoxal-5-phosphate-dependent protein subunit beta [Ignavibacteria bacterium CG1_02_37_35]
MINLKRNDKARKNNIQRCKEKGIVIPTFEQMKHPEKTPAKIKEQLKHVGLWDVNPLNLFRISWKNEQKEFGGGFGGVNYIEFPSSLTGVKAKIIGISGKYFPTGAHKVGATFGCLAPALVTGNFDSTWQKAVWPSTGNFCRGGAFNSALLGCESIAILPEEMSKERFDWLKNLAGEVIATPGCESNVKEIFDKCWELKRTRKDILIFNQFEEFGNYLWHYEVTASAVEEVFEEMKKSLGGKLRLAGYVSATGSGGTIAAGDYLKEKYPSCKIGASEALQCPTLLQNGFGGHRIEGIGDKHVPWIHNVKNTDFVFAIDDEDCMELSRLFNDEEGKKYLLKEGVDEQTVAKLSAAGISGIANMLSAVKLAKYYELHEHDVIFTILTDSMELYGSRLEEMNDKYGKYSELDAAKSFHKSLQGQRTDNMLELNYQDKKRIHNLKYFTWIEQQQRELGELNAQWNDEEYWNSTRSLTGKIDSLIEEFNNEVGLL